MALAQFQPLIPRMKKYWKGYVLGIVTVLCNNGLWVLTPLVIGAIVDDLNHHGVWHGHLLKWCYALVALAAGKGVFQFLTRWVVIGISRDIEFDLRNDLFRHLAALDFDFFQRTRTGDIMARATNDLNAVRMLLGPAIMYSANTLTFTALALYFMLRISPRLTLWAFLPLPVASIIVQYFGSRINERFERIQAKFSDISARAQENFSGARLIRAYAQEESEIALFEHDNRVYIQRALPLAQLTAMLWPTLELMLGMAIVVVLWKGGLEVLAHRLSVGDFTAFNSYMMLLMWPVIALGWVINIFQRGTASMGRIEEIFRQQPTIADTSEAMVSDEPLRGEIEFRNLRFAYPLVSQSEREAHTPKTARVATSENGGSDVKPSSNGNGEANGVAAAALSNDEAETISPSDESRHAPAEEVEHGDHLPRASGLCGPEVLHDINLKIPAGSSLAIVGPTGSGKSTLVSLIPRILDAADGMVLLDGRPLRQYAIATLRRNIGFVPQETFLFSTSLRENIAFGVEQATVEQVEEAARIASIAQDIEAFPERYETVVGERGLTLSGGQKQRTAIARAVIRSPRILILDDALASVDTNTEERILEGLRQLMHGRTTIFISHRVSTARNADRIAVLHHGSIVEYGTHDELLAKNGYYTSLYSKQQLEEELETA